MLTPGNILLYRFCDSLSGVLILAMAVFSPWAFGTTQPWSIWSMNISGYTLGLLLLIKLSVRYGKAYRPPRWDSHSAQVAAPQEIASSSPVAEDRAASTLPRFTQARVLTAALVVLTIALLGFTLTSAINARATWLPLELRFEYHNNFQRLPQSMDSTSTWFAFWQYLGLACAFWGLRDWLLGKAGQEEMVPRHSKRLSNPVSQLPARLRLLLWVLAINGGLLAIEGMIQRIEGSGRLLFLVQPRVNPDAVTQFGPYAYRSNASQYLNLLWPLCLGFWWRLHRGGGMRHSRHHLLLLCAALMAAACMVSTSRGGALVAAGLIVGSTLLLLGGQLLLRGGRHETRFSRRIASFGVLLFVAVALALGFSLGWESLSPRLAEMPRGYEQREQMYEVARPMAADYPVFGTGPGTFEAVFQLYRPSTSTYWPAQLHNDWLETRITFGWFGSSLVCSALLVILARWFMRGGVHCGRRFIGLAWMSVAGCLIHARWDFPFQIHSIVFLFLIICAMLSILSRRTALN